jgi:hypothetical protein
MAALVPRASVHLQTFDKTGAANPNTHFEELLLSCPWRCKLKLLSVHFFIEESGKDQYK